MIYASADERQDGQGGATPEMMQIDPRLQVCLSLSLSLSLSF